MFQCLIANRRTKEDRRVAAGIYRCAAAGNFSKERAIHPGRIALAVWPRPDAPVASPQSRILLNAKRIVPLRSVFAKNSLAVGERA